MKKTARTHQVSATPLLRDSLPRLMYNLLYPAVLGTMFYSLLPPIAEAIHGGKSLDVLWEWETVVGALIVVHFAVDYLCAQKVETSPIPAFLIDFAIVFLLLLAFDAAQTGNDGELRVSLVARYMTLAYLFFLVWLVRTWRRLTHSRRILVVELLGLAWFTAIWLWVPSRLLLAVALAVCSVLLAWLGMTTADRPPGKSH